MVWKECSLLLSYFNDARQNMAGSRKLSDDEVEALLGGLEEETVSQSSGQFNPNEVREFAFGLKIFHC